MEPIQVGTEAPDFTLRDQDRTEHTLSGYRGQPVVLLFYPLDFSSVCTEEMSCVVNNMPRFKDLDAKVFGVSIDSIYSHKAFAQQLGVDYPLLADFHPKGKMSRSYGMYLDERGHTTRGYVVVAPDGTVAAVKDVGAPNLPDFDEIAAAVEAVRGSGQ